MQCVCVSPTYNHYKRLLMNTPIRGSRMYESAIIRLTTDDKAKLKLLSQQRQQSISHIIRDLLIRNNYITPTGDTTNEW